MANTGLTNGKLRDFPTKEGCTMPKFVVSVLTIATAGFLAIEKPGYIVNLTSDIPEPMVGCFVLRWLQPDLACVTRLND